MRRKCHSSKCTEKNNYLYPFLAIYCRLLIKPNETGTIDRILANSFRLKITAIRN